MYINKAEPIIHTENVSAGQTPMIRVYTRQGVTGGM